MIDDQGRWGGVTGASLGSGEPFAQRHAGRGMPLVRTGRNHSRIDEVAYPDAIGVDTAPRWAGSMTISRPAEVQAGCGAAKRAERD
jgi:NADP-dependent 3-hydroxy acid dehydrogenase YdfG